MDRFDLPKPVTSDWKYSSTPEIFGRGLDLGTVRPCTADGLVGRFPGAPR